MPIKYLALKSIGIKFRESLSAVLPIIVIVLILTATAAPVPSGTLLSFIFGSAMLIVGMMFFTLGSEMSMSKIGETVGSSVTKSRKMWFIILIAFVTGFIITVAEPDLTVFASQISEVPSAVLICAVSGGVGLFLVLAVLRIFFRIPLARLLTVLYIITFVLAFFVPEEFLAVAFDSGGVTTGPMTVPFIMAYGIGIACIRSDRNASDDSFGLVSLCSVGPIIAVMILGICYGTKGGSYVPPEISNVATSVENFRIFADAIPSYMLEMMISLLPIIIFYFLFCTFSCRPTKHNLIKITVGIAYTYFGLVVFMTGVNVGFLPMGNYIGQTLAAKGQPWILIPIAMVMGYFVVKAEPAVYVLNKQVEELTDGGIRAKTMGLALSIGVSVSLGLSMARIVFDIPLLYFLVPGYLIAIGTSFFVPKLYSAIAFDSGGVASGPMTAAFLLPFAQGACLALGKNVAVNAFGIVSMVAMTPLITIQVLGLVDMLNKKKKAAPVITADDAYAVFPDDGIIEL